MRFYEMNSIECGNRESSRGVRLKRPEAHESMRITTFTILLAVLSLAACSGTTGDSNPNPLGPTPPTNRPQTGLLAFSTTASRGWSSIDVYVNGGYVGTLRRYQSPGNTASCTADPDARVVATLAPGDYAFTARSNAGAVWTGTSSVSVGGCREITLTCNGGDCSR
jgi:hypothetical protein